MRTFVMLLLNLMRFIFLTFLFGNPFLAIAQKIELLKSDDDIFAFVKSIDSNFNKYLRKTPFEKIAPIFPDYADTICKEEIKKRNIKLWEKADFDNNGKQDLLINSECYERACSFVVMAFANDSFSIKYISNRVFEPCRLPRRIKVANNDALEIFYYHRSLRTADQTDWKTDTLIYYWNNFVEVPKQTTTTNISRVEFSTSFCYGTCPVFKIVIDSNKNVFYKAVQYNSQPDGDYEATLDNSLFQSLCDLLNTIGFTTLEENYSVDWTDDQTSTLTITYDNGKTKRITDYGELGSYGLIQVYNYFFELRNNMKWEKIK